jgi:two-component system sensor histidine kinase YesM
MKNVKAQYKHSIIRKMILATMSLLLIPVTAICVIYIYLFFQSQTERVDTDLKGVVSSMQSDIDKTLSSAETMMDEFFYRQEFSYFMNGKNELSDREINYYIGSVQKELINNKYLYSNIFGNIGMYSENKQIDSYKYMWQFYLSDFKKLPYYNEINSETNSNIYGAVRKTNLATVNYEPSTSILDETSSYVLPIYRSVYDVGSGERVGIIETDVNVQRLIQVNELNKKSPKVIKILLDKKKHFLFDTGKKGEAFEKTVVPSLTKTTSNTTFAIGEEKYRMSYTTDKVSGLTSIAIISQKEIYQNIESMIFNVLLITIVCLGIMGVITYVVIKNMLNRLVVVDKMMEKVQDGNFELKIEDDGKSDEITSIGKSFNVMVARLDDVLEEKVRNEQIQKDAEIKALQAQINPHFLYNTLETMRMQCEIEGNYSMSNCLATLGELFRYSIKWGTKEVEFELEWTNLKNYLYIMNMRYEDVFECELICEDGLEDIIIPKMILQPLAENSFSHAFRKKMPPWKMKVVAKKEENFLVIIVEDDGSGIAKDELKHIQKCLAENREIKEEFMDKANGSANKHTSIGLSNVNRRINMICKEGSYMTIESEVGVGTKISIFVNL